MRERYCLNPLIKTHSVIQIWTFLDTVRGVYFVFVSVFFCMFATPADCYILYTNINNGIFLYITDSATTLFGTITRIRSDVPCNCKKIIWKAKKWQCYSLHFTVIQTRKCKCRTKGRVQEVSSDRCWYWYSDESLFCEVCAVSMTMTLYEFVVLSL